MRIKLSLHGGIYGTVHLEPIETEDKGVAIPDEVLKFIKSPGLERYVEGAGGASPADPGRPRTEEETYRLAISGEGGEPKQCVFSKSAAAADSDLQRLVDFVWSKSRPAQSS